jgi:aldose 1-epimerase
MGTLSHQPACATESLRLIIGQQPGIEVELSSLGATITRLEVSDQHGARRNVVLGYDHDEEYATGPVFLGGVIGRYANRIAHGQCDLDGTPVQLDTTDRGHHLHGEPHGFHRRVWNVEDISPEHVRFDLLSPEGDQGLPGTVRVSATYTVRGNDLDLRLCAWTTAPTLLNLTNHAYFNLDGWGEGTIDTHELQVFADRYHPTYADGIPFGPPADVAGTAFDFRQPSALGPRLRGADEQILSAHGIDHNFVIDGDGWRKAADLKAARSGLRMYVWTDQPGLQVYTGNFLDGTQHSSRGRLLRQGDGIALEPQLPPNSPNEPSYPSAVLRPGEEYRSNIRWSFYRC